MTKAQLIKRLAARQPHLTREDVAEGVKKLLEQLSDHLGRGERIEIRGFGRFDVRYRPARMGRNPKTGEPVALPAKYVPHFKPSATLNERVSATGRRRDDKPSATTESERRPVDSQASHER